MMEKFEKRQALLMENFVVLEDFSGLRLVSGFLGWTKTRVSSCLA